MMPSHRLSHIAKTGTHIWAFGATWLTPAEQQTNLRRTAVNAAKKANAPFYALRPVQRQYGIFSPPPRTKAPRAKWYSAAAAVAAAYSSHTLAIWQIGALNFDTPLWWVCVIRQGRVAYDGDRVFDSEQDARTFFESQHNGTETIWKTVIAPQSWGISGSDDVPLPSILGKAKPIPFQSTSFVSAGTALPITIAIIASVIVVYSLANRTKRPTKRAVPAIVHQSGAAIGPALDACIGTVRGNFSKLVTIGGWSFSSMTCTDGLLTTQLVAETGTPITSLTRIFPEAQIDTGATRSGIVRLPFPGHSQIIPPGPVTTATSIRVLAERLYADLTISGETPVPNQPTYRQVAWTLTTEAPDSMWLPIIQALPSTALASARLEDKSNILYWTITGITYVQ